MNRPLLILGFFGSLTIHWWLIFLATNAPLDGSVQAVTIEIQKISELYPPALETPPTSEALPRSAETKPAVDSTPTELEKPVVREKPKPNPKQKPTPKPTPKPKAAPAASPQAVPPPAASASKARPPKTSSETPGSFSGQEHGQEGPRLRIDWPSQQHALEVIRAGRLKLVVIEVQPRPRIVTEVRIDANGFAQRTQHQPDLYGYDPEVRYVSRLPAFSGVSASLDLRVHEELALVLPRKIAEAVRLSQSRAVENAGLAWEEAAVTAGRFRVESSRLVFGTHRVVAR